MPTLAPGYKHSRESPVLYDTHGKRRPSLALPPIHSAMNIVPSKLFPSSTTSRALEAAKNRHHSRKERYLLKIVDNIQTRLTAKALGTTPQPALEVQEEMEEKTSKKSRLPSISTRLQKLHLLALDEEVEEVIIQPVAATIPEVIVEVPAEHETSAEPQPTPPLDLPQSRPRRKPCLLRERSVSESSWCLQRLLSEMKEENLQGNSRTTVQHTSGSDRKVHAWRRVSNGSQAHELSLMRGSDGTPESRGLNRWRQTRKILFGDAQHNLLLMVVKKLRGQNYVSKKGRLLRRVQSVDNFNQRKPFRKVVPIVRFRRAVRSVMVLLKVNLASRRTAHTAGQTPLSWTDIQASIDTSRRADELCGVTFDPSYYRARREARISSEAKAILTLEAQERTGEQLKAAIVALKAAVEAFGEFPIKMQQSLVRVCWYEQYEAKRVIIRQGHVADYFYFILSGTAVVTILETNKQTGEQSANTVAFLKKGNSFGELALMHGARRSATVTCKEDMELLAVGREDFIDIFMPVVKDREPHHIAFLRSVDLLAGWPLDKLPPTDPLICLATYFRRGVLLCRDSNTSEWIYVVMSGSCRVLKTLVATRPTIGRHDNRGDNYKAIGSPGSNWSTRVSRLGMNSRGCDTSCSERKLPERLQLLVDRTRDEDEVQRSEMEHRRRLEELFRQRHTHSNGDSQLLRTTGEEAERRSCCRRSRELVFVQLQSLGPKETFGLEHAVFSVMGQTTSTALVSEGAECVLISRKFFLQHLTEDTAKRMRGKMQPFPTEEALQQKLQTQTNWDAYKSMTISDLLEYRKLQDSLHY